MLRAEIRRRNRLRLLAFLFVALSLFLTVRASPVYVASPSPGPVEAAACRSLVVRLPATLDGRSMRPVTPDTGLTAAWGRPTITLACGLAADPHPVSSEEVCFGATSCTGAVQWFQDPFDAELWKTRTSPHLAVVIPGADGLADVLSPISAAVQAH